MRIIGIDPGFSGAIAIYDNDEDFDKPKIIANVMPVTLVGKKPYLNMREIVNTIKVVNPDMIFIEEVTAMPKQGVTSTFRFGVGFGILQGICSALGIVTHYVKPQIWKKEILSGYNKSEKNASIYFLQRTYPLLDLRKSNKAIKPHDGIADAICISLYGVQKYKGSVL